MSRKRFAGCITDADRRIFKIWKIVVSEGRDALHCVFKWGCKKTSTESIEEYLKKKKGMSNAKYNNEFNKLMRETIKKDPYGDTYDVSLLYACIKMGCDLPEGPDWEKEKDNLESLCTTVKDYRNRLAHGEEIKDHEDMEKWCEDITEVLQKLLKSAGEIFCLPDSEIQSKIDKANEQIKEIREASLGGDDDLKLQEEILEFRKEIREAIVEEKCMLKERYKDMSKIDPASFITGEERLHVKNVFTMLEVVCERKDDTKDDTYDIGYNDLLEVVTEGVKPKIILVEGDAGAGKTTLTKLILSDWSEDSTIFNGLNNYDLVLRGEGKNRNISSYLQLIQVLMPTASYKYCDDELVRSVLRMKVLLVVDGFDELNPESEKFIKELLEKCIPESDGKLHVLITTRPSKLTDLRSVLTSTSHSILHVKLKGISMEKRVEFVSKLHDEMIKKGQSKQETQKLVEFMKKSQSRLREHFRLPLNLTLLTYLWASDPGKVNPQTTATSLYIAIMELIQSRLLVRLQGKLGWTSRTTYKFEEAIQIVLEELYSVSLKALHSNSMQLSDESTKALREKCSQLELPFDDVTDAFLSVEKEWTRTGYKIDLTVPHKSILEFYAAKQFIKYMKNENDQSSLIKELKPILKKNDVSKEDMENIMRYVNKYSKCEEAKSLKEICQKHLGTEQDLEAYENMFLHLTGLLALQCPDSLRESSEELVAILKNAGYRGTKWLDLLVEAQCDDKLARLVAPLSSVLTVHDGHTGAALVLFESLTTNTKVNIILENEVSYIPQLDDMLLQLSKRDCDVELTLKHQWKHKEYGYSDELLKNLLSEDHRCRVIKFTGHLKTLCCLPETLTKLRITFATTEHAKQLLAELANYKERSNIKHIGIHVMSEVTAEGLSPLPSLNHENTQCGTLWLSKVTGDWQAKCNVIRALLPEGGTFNSIMFPQSNFSKNQCEMIFKELKRLEVKVGKKGGIRLSSSTIQKEELPDLKNFAKQTLDCALYCSMNESRMW